MISLKIIAAEGSQEFIWVVHLFCPGTFKMMKSTPAKWDLHITQNKFSKCWTLRHLRMILLKFITDSFTYVKHQEVETLKAPSIILSKLVRVLEK